MNKELFVQNIEKYCAALGVKPTVACRESGAGVGLLQNLKRGSMPSIDKIATLATYLGVTLNDLVGEDIISSSRGPDQPYLVRQYNRLSKQAQMEVRAFIEFKVTQETEAVEGSIPMEELGDTRPVGVKELEVQQEETQQEKKQND